MITMRAVALIALISMLAISFGSAQYIAPGQNNTRILQNNSTYTSWNGTGLPTTPTGTNYSELNVTGPKEQNVINNTYQEIQQGVNEVRPSEERKPNEEASEKQAEANETKTANGTASTTEKNPGFESVLALTGLAIMGYFLSGRRN